MIGIHGTSLVLREGFDDLVKVQSLFVCLILMILSAAMSVQNMLVMTVAMTVVVAMIVVHAVIVTMVVTMRMLSAWMALVPVMPAVGGRIQGKVLVSSGSVREPVPILLGPGLLSDAWLQARLPGCWIHPCREVVNWTVGGATCEGVNFF